MIQLQLALRLFCRGALTKRHAIVS
uniref:Uncharacterized protein n=1 Tax=Arundo donax TaxID=35708 RepID=A0A0A8YTY2_ARUDO